MRHRPWPVVILALFHVLSPVGNVFLSAYLQKDSVLRYLMGYVEAKDWIGTAMLFGFMPAAGFALYLYKSWSYWAYLAIMAGVALLNLDTWRSHPDMVSLPTILGIIALDLGIATYFFIPSVRAPYFNPRMRWWESKPRYAINQTAYGKKLLSSARLKITNMSEGGVFFQSPTHFELHDLFTINFVFRGEEFSIESKVVHSQKHGKQKGFGAQFMFGKDGAKKAQIRGMIKTLKAMGFPCERDDFSWTADLKTWAKGVLKGGRGLVPEPVYRPGKAKPTGKTTAKTSKKKTTAKKRDASNAQRDASKVQSAPQTADSNEPAVSEDSDTKLKAA